MDKTTASAIFSASLAFAAVPAMAQEAAPAASFAAPFTSHAVLQRDCTLPVWGRAAPGAAVEVSLDGQTVSAVASEDGAWRVDFPPQRVPGLGHELSLRVGGETVATLDDVAIGDVWLCSGQSTMDMNYGWGLTRGKEDIETADDPMMRLFDDHNAASTEPLAELPVPTAWTASDFAHSKTFSACGWFFGQALRKVLPDVPIGLVEASWSGSPIKTWLSAESYCRVKPDGADEIEAARGRAAEFEAAGGKAEFQKRLELWVAECKTRGDIHAEGAGYDDSAWAPVQLPATFEKHIDKDFDGRVWYRRHVTLTAEEAARGATLTLGAIDDEDVTWVNGVEVGSTKGYDKERKYAVPAGVLREGDNVVAVSAIDWRVGGGFTTDRPEQLALALDGGAKIPLAGEWKFEAFRFDPKPVSGEINAWVPTACYNAMLHPLFPMALKGAIWYQGCSDVGHADLYDSLFRAMVADWRAGFTHPDGMPVYLVQLAAFKETHDEPFDSKWAEMRWTHMKIGETLENGGTAVAIDVGHHTDIHPKDKKTVGERLARLALARTYGVAGLVEAGPVPLAVRADGARIVVSFKNAAGLGTSGGGPVKGFQIVGADGSATWAAASVEGETVAVEVPEGVAPARVRYAWDDYPDCNLVNGDALPAGPFEADVPQPGAAGAVF